MNQVVKERRNIQFLEETQDTGKSNGGGRNNNVEMCKKKLETKRQTLTKPLQNEALMPLLCKPN